MYLNPDINPRILTAVAKLIVAISWADGEIQDEELECLRSLLKELPDVPPEHINALESLLARPIEPTEREIIMDEFTRLIRSREERNFALYWLDRILEAKGTRDPAETAIYDEIINRFIQQGEIDPAAPVVSEAFQKDTDCETRVITTIDQIMEESRNFIDTDLLSDALLRRMLMLGVLAARITRADYRIDESEVEELRDFIRKQTGLDKAHALQLARLILVREFEHDSDVLMLCRLLREESSLKERNNWVDELVRISEQDGVIVDAEMNQIISIAAALETEQERFENVLHTVLDKTA